MNIKFIKNAILLFFVISFLLMGVLQQLQAQANAANLLTNNDIIKMVKAGVSDDAIITLIRKSPTKFDTSPKSIINLKRAKVSNTIIEAILGSQATSTNEAQQPLVPTAYGNYIIDKEQMVGLEIAPVTTIMGLQLGGGDNPGIAVDGLAGEPSQEFDNASPIFIVYQQNIDINSIKFSILKYVSTLQAYTFNMNNTDPAFFRNLYGRGYNDIIQINLWRPGRNIPLRIEPVEQKRGMYRLIPASPLASGKYALYFRDDIHNNGIIFVTKPNRTSSAIYFGIK